MIVMTPRKIRRDDVKALSPADRSMLCSTYLHCCMTGEQAYQHYYRVEREKRTYADWHIREMLTKGYLTEQQYTTKKGVETALFLTTTGVALAKRLFSIPSTELREAPDRCSGYDWKSHDLMLRPTKINHQVHLNEFSMCLAETLWDVDWSYYDEKYQQNKSIYSARARADAIAELPRNTLYLELDMNTERPAALREKWYGYQTLFNSNEFFQSAEEKKATILFVLDNVTRPEMRTRTVIRTLLESGLLSQFGSTVEFQVGTSSEMLRAAREIAVGTTPQIVEQARKLLKERHGFREIKPIRVDGVPEYVLYASLGDDLYAVDFYDALRGSVLSKMLTANRDMVLLQEATGRKVKHLVVTNFSVELLRYANLIGCGGMLANHYADIQDLKALPFEKAVHKIDGFGRMV